jgi:HK97 family phage portal protein
LWFNAGQFKGLAQRLAIAYRSLTNPSDLLKRALMGDDAWDTRAGVNIGPKTALTLPAYYCALRNIAEDVGKLPLHLYKRKKPRGRERAEAHFLYPILHDSPNRLYTSMAFWETLVLHALGWGNGYAQIVMDGGGTIAGMYILDPSTVRVESAFVDGEWRLTYIVNPKRGGQYKLRDDQIFHLHGLGFDGIMGYSVATIGREAIGEGIGTARSGASMIGKGVRPSGWLELDHAVKEGGKQLKESFAKAYASGPDSHGGIPLLVKGEHFKTSDIMSNKDAMWIDARLFNVWDMCRIVRITPYKLFDLSHGTYSNVQHLAIEYVQDTIMPWLKRITQEIHRKLLLPREQRTYYAEHIIEELLRGDSAARAAFHASARQWGYASANDVREKENENPIGKEGDVYLVQGGYVDAKTLLEKPEEPIETPAPEGPGTEEMIERIINSQRPTLEAAYRRILGTETEKIERHAKRDDFDIWRREFYAEHRGYVEGMLLTDVESACQAAWVATGIEAALSIDAVIDHTKLMAIRHVDESLKANMNGRLTETLAEWRDKRPIETVGTELKNLTTLVRRLYLEANYARKG